MTADLVALAPHLDGAPSIARTRRWLFGGEHAPGAAMWPDAWVAALEVDVRREIAQAWLAPGLVASTPARATLFFARYARTGFGVAYQECGLLLHARHRRRDVASCVWMVVDDDTAMILGRELLGFPKKLARIEIAERDDHVEVEVARRGVTLLRASFVAGAPTSPRPAFARPIVNVWGPPGAPSVLLCLDVPERAHETRLAVASLRVRGSIADPLDALAMDCERQEGAVTRTNVGLAPARVHTIPPGVRPVGLVSPAWLARQLPLRSL